MTHTFDQKLLDGMKRGVIATGNVIALLRKENGMMGVLGCRVLGMVVFGVRGRIEGEKERGDGFFSSIQWMRESSLSIQMLVEHFTHPPSLFSFLPYLRVALLYKSTTTTLSSLTLAERRQDMTREERERRQKEKVSRR